MARMFISYSRVNKPFVKELVTLLGRVYPDHEVWFDEDISGGEDWWQRILGEIMRCDMFIYMMSNNALESEYCQAEFREALRLQKLCLPVLVNPKTDVSLAPPVLEQEIRRREWVNMSGGLADYHANAKLYAAINRLLKNSPQGSLPPLSNDPVSKPDISLIQMRTDRKGKSFRRVPPNVVIGLISLLLAAIIIAVIGPIANQNNGGVPTLDQITASSLSVFTHSQAVDETHLITSAPNTAANTEIWTEVPTLTNVLLSIETSTSISSGNGWTIVEYQFNGVEMVLVPAGCFNMGNDPEAYYWNTRWLKGVPDGGQQCFSKPFWIDRYEITNEQFKRLGGVAVESGDWGEPQQPRTNVTWFEARDFCEKNRDIRLPTEVEWEYAARGPNNLLYPWGNEFIAENVTYSNNSNGRTASVGNKVGGMSWIGAYDLGGNVWEWVRSMYKDYPYNTRDGREDETPETSGRVLRGGSWYNDSAAMRSATRLWANPSEQDSHGGFRCVHS